MTKYKTNAQKLKFFNDAKAARMPKATVGRIMIKPKALKPLPPTGPWESSPNPPNGPDARVKNGVVDNWYTNTTAGEIPNVSPYGKNPSRYTPEQIAEFTGILDQFKNRPMKKGGSVKRKKRK